MTPHARGATSAPKQLRLAAQLIKYPRVNSSTPLSFQSFIPSDGDTKQERPDTKAETVWTLRAIQNQDESFKAEYATIDDIAKRLAYPAFEGPIVSDSLLRKEWISSAIHISTLIVVETFKSYPLKRWQ